MTAQRCSTLLAGVILSLLTISPALAQSPNAQQKPADPAAVKEAIAIVKERIDRQIRRVSDLSGEIIRLDTRIEREVAQIVTDLSQVGDSKDSRTEVAKLKEKVTTGLKRSIEKYQRARAGVNLELQNTQAGQTRQDLKGDLNQFDQRIENRVNQIVQISQSLTTEKDFQAYDNYLRDTRNDRSYHSDVRRLKSEARTQNKRVTRLTDQQRSDTIDALKRSITHLENQNKLLKSRLNSIQYAAQADIIQEDIDRNQQAIMSRDAQISALESYQQSPTIPISRRDAKEKENLIRDAASFLKRDVDTLFRHYSEFQRERRQQNGLMQQLQVLEAMLK
ncbi:MAG: hypothetical protein L3J39_16160 [Verrucomicrobiales bacterium]|nr:hypothetical protein [Verrucomicrobiales bacterium]